MQRFVNSIVIKQLNWRLFVTLRQQYSYYRIVICITSKTVEDLDVVDDDDVEHDVDDGPRE